MTRDDWIARAQTIVSELRTLLAPYGLPIDPALRVASDHHPCPGYVHETKTIGFCAPVIDRPVDRLRWLVYTKYMGCASIDEARSFYDVALPFVIAHETSHHLRITLGLDAESPFVEEQACDRLAAAMVDALDHHRASLVTLQARCAAMRATLAERFTALPTTAFVPHLGDLSVDQDRISALRRIGAREGLSLDAMMELVPGLDLEDAEEARDRARAHLDLHYTRDPAEYWYASVVWLERYLATEQRPRLIEVLNTHLRGDERADAEWISALEHALSSPDAVIVAGAAATLLQRFGANVEGPPIASLRAEEMQAELAGVPLPSEAIARALEAAQGLLALAALAEQARPAERNHGPRDDARARFAIDALVLLARKLAVEIGLAVAPQQRLSAVAAIAGLVDRAGDIESVLLDLFLEHVEGDLAIDLRRVFTGGASGETPPCDTTRVPPVVRAALEGYHPDERVRTLLDTVIALRSVPLFAGLTADQLADLADSAIERRHATGELVVREGERGDELHVLLEGQISIVRGAVRLATLAPPSCFGEMALFDGALRSASAIAVSPCRLLTLEGEALRRAGRRDPGLYESLLRELSNRLRQASARIDE